MKKTAKLLLVLCLAPIPSVLHGKDFEVVNNNTDSSKATHRIKSEANGKFLQIGVSEDGGGFINELQFVKDVDIMPPFTTAYGRGGQMTIRDIKHGGRYNPTQAGFSDEGGTICPVIQNAPNRPIRVPARVCALFAGDNKFDFTEWENLASDRYVADGVTSGRGSDTDNTPDGFENATIGGRIIDKQALEVSSEFDFYGEYSDLTNSEIGKSLKISIPAIRFYSEQRYVRKPSHCLEQHVNGPLYVGKSLVDNIPNLKPAGIYEDNADRFAIVAITCSLRFANDVYLPDFRWIAPEDSGGVLKRYPRDSVRLVQYYENKALQNKTNLNGEAYPQLDPGMFDSNVVSSAPLIVYSDAGSYENADAIGFYKPNSDINVNSIQAIKQTDGSEVYKDDRRLHSTILDSIERVKDPLKDGQPDMQVVSFNTQLTGILEKSAGNDEVYEKIRSEWIILRGTPKEIWENAQRIHPFN